MQVRVVRPSDLGDAELGIWRAFQRDDPTLASPFLTPEFALAVDGARDDARIGVVEEGDGPVAFFPFSTEDGSTGEPLGASICDAQALISRAGTECDPAVLVRGVGLDVWHFDHLLATQTAFAPFHHALHRAPVVSLTDGLDAYLAQVRSTSKDVLPQVARRRRKLGREVGDVVFEWQTADRDALDTLFEWKSAQYRETGVWDRFDQPWIIDVVRKLACTTGDDVSGLLSTLRAGNNLVAVHFGLLGRDRLSWWFPVYNGEFARYSPGLILLLDLVAEAAARGVLLVDLGRGEHHYKLRVATGSYAVAEGAVVRGSP
jgi:CelD/BcsL family acetyltransferase involved in cellulose biosynthesis